MKRSEIKILDLKKKSFLAVQMRKKLWSAIMRRQRRDVLDNRDDGISAWVELLATTD